MVCFKRANNCSEPTGQYGEGGEQSYGRWPRTPLGTKNKHNTKKITTNAPAWVRSLQRTDCPILKLAYFCLFFHFLLLLLLF